MSDRTMVRTDACALKEKITIYSDAPDPLSCLILISIHWIWVIRSINLENLIALHEYFFILSSFSRR